MSEQVTVAERIAKVVSVPVLVDGHTGFGGPAHVARTVQEFEAAGIAGIHIEDQVFPKSISYHQGVKEIVDIETAILRFRAANDAKTDPDFAVMARTDAWGARNGGLTETIRRCEAFVAAGADILVPLVFDLDDITAVREAVPEPHMVWLGGTAGMNIRSTSDAQGRIRKYPELTVDDIFDLGFSIVLYPSAAIMAAVLAVDGFLHTLNVDGAWAPEGAGRAREMIEAILQLENRYAVEPGTEGGKL